MKALWRRSAALRITLLLGALILVFVTIGSALQYRQTERLLTRQLAEVLAADLDGYAALYAQRRIIALRQALEFRAETDPEAATLLLDKSGTRLAGTLQVWPENLPPVGNGFSSESNQSFLLDGKPYLGVARLLPGGFPFLIARPASEVGDALASLRRSIYWLLCGLAVFSAAAGFLVSRGLMARIARLNTLVDTVSKGEPLPPADPGPDELGQLESHIRRMLERIENLMTATRRLSDAIAHEL